MLKSAELGILDSVFSEFVFDSERFLSMFLAKSVLFRQSPLPCHIAFS